MGECRIGGICLASRLLLVLKTVRRFFVFSVNIKDFLYSFLLYVCMFLWCKFDANFLFGLLEQVCQG